MPIPMKTLNAHAPPDSREVSASPTSTIASVMIAGTANVWIASPITLVLAIPDGQVGSVTRTWTNACPDPVCTEARVSRPQSRAVTTALAPTNIKDRIANRNAIVLVPMILVSMDPAIQSKMMTTGNFTNVTALHCTTEWIAIKNATFAKNHGSLVKMGQLAHPSIALW